MTNYKKITIILCSILFAFVGFFGIFLATSNDSVVKADTIESSVVNFQSNTITLPCAYFTTSGNLNSSVTTSNVFLSFDITSLGNTSGFPSVTIHYYIAGFGNTSSYSQTSVGTLSSSLAASNSWHNNWLSFTYVYNNSSNTRYIVIPVIVDTAFNNNINRIVISSVSTPDTLGSFYGSNIDFFDTNNNKMRVQIPIYATTTRTSLYREMIPSRTIYIDPTLTDNEYYQAGLQQGLIDNQSNIYNAGYNKAIEDNQSNWEQTGYNRGVQDANDYTFLGLIGATIDAPITALFGHIDTDSSSSTYNQRIGGFFNFELLGVNLKDFFFAVLTFAVVIVIVRFAIGK